MSNLAQQKSYGGTSDAFLDRLREIRPVDVGVILGCDGYTASVQLFDVFQGEPVVIHNVEVLGQYTVNPQGEYCIVLRPQTPVVELGASRISSSSPDYAPVGTKCIPVYLRKDIRAGYTGKSRFAIGNVTFTEDGVTVENSANDNTLVEINDTAVTIGVAGVTASWSDGKMTVNAGVTDNPVTVTLNADGSLSAIQENDGALDIEVGVDGSASLTNSKGSITIDADAAVTVTNEKGTYGIDKDGIISLNGTDEGVPLASELKTQLDKCTKRIDDLIKAVNTFSTTKVLGVTGQCTDNTTPALTKALAQLGTDLAAIKDKEDYSKIESTVVKQLKKNS